MCELVTGLTALLAGTGATTAAGAGAAAATTAAAGAASGALATLQTIGTTLAIGGSVLQGVSAYQTSKANAALIEQQAGTEKQVFAIQEARERQEFLAGIAQQRSEIAARGLSLDSATAVYLGQSAAQELAFNSQSVRSTGQSRQTELSASQANAQARGRLGLLRGSLSAAGSFLSSREDQWKELLA
ncbi:hypothetical protein [Shimia sp.]|uniref:hypothetical protein n=1 Tax=Shimia sp. TaxID=1954381 RepID=UPI003BABE95B